MCVTTIMKHLIWHSLLSTILSLLIRSSSSVLLYVAVVLLVGGEVVERCVCVDRDPNRRDQKDQKELLEENPISNQTKIRHYCTDSSIRWIS